jgi:hypothetical protein
MEYAWPLCRSCGSALPHPWRSKRKRQKRVYCSTACVPDALRAANGRRAREVGTVRARLHRFRTEVQRLEGLARITGKDLLVSFAAIEAYARARGYACCESKWLRRMQKDASAA